MTLNGSETRWHFSSTVSPDITVPASSMWTDTTQVTRRMLLLTTQEATASPLANFPTSSSANGAAILAVQLTSPPLQPNVATQQRIPQLVVAAVNTGSSAWFLYNAYIYRPSTGARIGVMTYANGNTGLSDGTAIPSSYNSRVSNVALNGRTGTPATTQANDRMVVEFGYTPTTSSTAVVSFTLGNPGTAAYPDFPFSTGYNNVLSPWFTIDQDLNQARAMMPNAGKMRPRMFAPGVAR